MCELRAPSFYKTNPPLSIYIYAGGFIGGWGWAGSGGRTRLLRYVGGGACAATGCFMRAASGICLVVSFSQPDKAAAPGHAPHHLRQQPGETQLLATYSRKRWRGAYGTAAARNVKFIITELRDRFIGINGVPPKRRSTSARRVGAYYDARSSEWFG